MTKILNKKLKTIFNLNENDQLNVGNEVSADLNNKLDDASDINDRNETETDDQQNAQDNSQQEKQLMNSINDIDNQVVTLQAKAQGSQANPNEVQKLIILLNRKDNLYRKLVELRKQDQSAST